ncbi:MAG: 2-oxo acid dehydrogenase subunit E2 [Clostridia bacterium]|nr:2-oxo acid dehydrogenase subunit E2 [Clostridia bacterium]
MPRQGNTVESCIINEFRKQPGDKVEIGDVLFSYETDKAAFEETATVAGTLLANFFEEGDDVPCLFNVCVIGNPGDDFEQFRPTEDGNPDLEAMAAAFAAAAPAAAAAPVAIGDIKISPRARALAEKSNADLSQVVPTGPEGRVIERDVQALIDAGKIIGAAAAVAAPVVEAAPAAAPAAAAEAPAAAAPAVVELGVPCDDSYTEPMTNMRKVIAKGMTTSLSTMAQLTHNVSYDATEIKAARALYKAKGEAFGMDKISINDIILYVVSRTLAMPEHKALNANLIDDGKTMKYFRGVHLGVAVDTDRGLMVPTVFNADKMTLKEISDTVKKLAKECKEGKIKPDYLKGASFTVSNLGSMGIESFTPVINPPQTGILGVCAMKDAFKMENGEIKVYPSMGLSLTYDHRALDGTPASKFLVDLKKNLENYNLLLAKG